MVRKCVYAFAARPAGSIEFCSTISDSRASSSGVVTFPARSFLPISTRRVRLLRSAPTTSTNISAILPATISPRKIFARGSVRSNASRHSGNRRHIRRKRSRRSRGPRMRRRPPRQYARGLPQGLRASSGHRDVHAAAPPPLAKRKSDGKGAPRYAIAPGTLRVAFCGKVGAPRSRTDRADAEALPSKSGARSMRSRNEATCETFSRRP